MLGLPPPRTSGGEPSHRDRTRQGMLTKSWRRKPGKALAVFTVLTSLTGLAQAQQNGLFPLHPIQRERVPCPAEEPIYKLYRSQYYGYYPPQWRPFPQGWHLNSPEKPNRKAELEKNPVLPVAPTPPEEGEEGPMAPGGRQAIPNPPADDRSPFEMDRPDNTRPPGAGPARRPAAPAEEPSPFETPAPGPRTPQPSRPAPRVPGPGAPDPDTPGAPGAARNEPQQGDRGPLLAMPDATLPPVEEADAPGQPNVAESVFGGPAATAPIATDASSQPQPQPQPQPRRSRLSALFGGLGLNWLRR
jgi:hypothetical protein